MDGAIESLKFGSIGFLSETYMQELGSMVRKRT